MSFSRFFSSSDISSLKGKSFFKKKLLPDIIKQKVFPAIRGGYIDFYYKGGRLFKYENQKFKTHIKYAAVIPKRGKDDYLTKSKLKLYKPAIDFVSNYERIKENCANYSGVEARGVSSLYHKYSYLLNKNIVVLDIEVTFQSNTDDSSTDRIDILLYNIKEQKLQFVEAKHYSNNEIWSTGKPKVVNQISRYENQIKKNKSDIITAYNNYIDALNKLLNINLPKPLKIDKQVTLLIFGFDDDQKNGRLSSLILSMKPYKGKMYHHYKGMKVYCKGDMKNTKMSALWNAPVI